MIERFSELCKRQQHIAVTPVRCQIQAQVDLIFGQNFLTAYFQHLQTGIHHFGVNQMIHFPVRRQTRRQQCLRLAINFQHSGVPGRHLYGKHRFTTFYRAATSRLQNRIHDLSRHLNLTRIHPYQFQRLVSPPVQTAR